MKLIDGTGGYETDLGDRVEDSRTNWQQEELPAISVFDGDAIATATSPGKALGTVHSMSVLIRGAIEQGTTAANARKLLKDIQKAIRLDDKWKLAGVPLVMQTRPLRDAITRNPDSFEVEACEVEIDIQFITEKFNAEQ